MEKNTGKKKNKHQQQKQTTKKTKTEKTTRARWLFLEYFFAPKAKSIHGASTKEGGVEVTKPKGQNCQDGRKQMHGKGVWGPWVGSSGTPPDGRKKKSPEGLWGSGESGGHYAMIAIATPGYLVRDSSLSLVGSPILGTIGVKSTPIVLISGF